VIAVEKDARFLPALEVLQQAAPGKLAVVHGDILDVDEFQILAPHVLRTLSQPGSASSLSSSQALPQPLIPSQPPSLDCDNVKMMGNLPFNIATQLLIKWMHLLADRKGPFTFGMPSVHAVVVIVVVVVFNCLCY
jgi:16S rRNA A1518/A1519 N6-dimethyltransferase RsmA/KsgA/DIM1 with predicted DNA glycosylase/AP lyase activity